METLYHQTNKWVLETQQLFSQLEKKQPNLDIQAIENEIETKIQNINRYTKLSFIIYSYIVY
jgi:hypothetical protein